MALQTERIRTVDQVRAFLDGSEPVDYLPQDRDDAYEFVRRTLVRIGYPRLGRPGKGAVRQYLAKTTGLSRAQVTRLIGQHRATGRVVDRRRGHSGRPFERVYTAADIRLLAEVDEIGNQMCGPATCAVLRRAWEVFGDPRFEALGVPVQCAPVQFASFQDLPCQAHRVAAHEADGDADRRAPAPGAGRAARFCARGYRASGRPGW